MLLRCLVGFAGWGLLGQTPPSPTRSVTDPGVVTTRQNITPAGVQTIFNGRVQGVAFGADSAELWIANSGTVYRFDWRGNRVLARVAAGSSSGLQGIRYDSGAKRVIVSSVAERKVRVLSIAGETVTTIADGLGRNVAGSIAIAAKRPIAVLPLTGDDRIAILDLAEKNVRHTLDAGIAPFGAAVNAAGTIAYVTNWGGRRPAAGDLTAITGYAADAAHVVVDRRGIASTGTVTRVDLNAGRVTHAIPVGLHPTAMVWDEPRGRLYVANGNEDSVSVIDTESNRALRTIPLQPFRERAFGIAPTALAISADGARLFVACGGINAAAVIRTANGSLEGMIPTGWYPGGLALSPDGKYLAISTLLGAGSGWREEPRKRFVHAVRGSVSVVELPDAGQLASYTAAVAENNHLAPAGTPGAPVAPDRDARPAAIPTKAGNPSLIEHVVFIIKENRTYEQVLGDIGKGNGDPSLVMFGEDVTPNQHRLANEFVLLDNFYATGGNSADGHQWLTQANEVDYCLWPGYSSRSYPFDGSDPIAYSNSGFLWDAALKMKKSVRVYGEYAGIVRERQDRHALLQAWKRGEDFTARWKTVAPIAPLNDLLAQNYPAYTTAIPDVARAQIFLADLRKWETAGRMPNLTIVQLPSNHTNGATPGSSSAKAMVADNDLALGRMVEALTRSPFWKKMAIFVVEDDAQNGVDHVDGHRTVALAISPYIRRGAIDSTFYSHQSILKTIELILGLPSLTLFDLIANEMRPAFQNTPDFGGYQAVEPKQSLFEVNPAQQALRGQARRDARASAKMRWDVPDAAPSGLLNRILWRQTRGYAAPYPGTKRSVFSPLSLDVEDDDR
jgi:YVTN family beta-propeller protein